MEKLEYIPGDLVMTNGVSGGTAKDVVVSIIFAPSVIAPALLTAYDVWEPVSYSAPSK